MKLKTILIAGYAHNFDSLHDGSTACVTGVWGTMLRIKYNKLTSQLPFFYSISSKTFETNSILKCTAI